MNHITQVQDLYLNGDQVHQKDGDDGLFAIIL